jgi:hypothetical protein
MGPDPIWAADLVALTVTTVAAVWVGLWELPQSVRSAWRAVRDQRHHDPPEPVVRPLQQVASHARRLGRRYHQPPAGRSFAKLEAIRRAYDDVLAECCDRLRIEHLLHVLPPGEELDVERARVERRLELSGLDLHLTP